MSVKPELAFDVCWEVYRGAREVLETKRGISALRPEKAGKFLWRPDVHARLNEWVADFALAGQAALEPERASRLVMFRMYYLGMAPYETARHFLRNLWWSLFSLLSPLPAPDHQRKTRARRGGDTAPYVGGDGRVRTETHFSLHRKTSTYCLATPL